MRVIAGQWRGRRLMTPKDDSIRPTADRVKEAWMSIISPSIAEAKVLDLFCGSGALGIEALSRGAASVDFVESAVPSLQLLNENLALVNAGHAAIVHHVNAIRYIRVLEADAFDIAFADPPYEKGLAQQVAEAWLETPFAGILCIEHRSFDKLPGSGDARRYGDTTITFYRA